MELNKYVSNHSFVSYIKIDLKDLIFIPFNISIGWWS
jgi:hypothetical protein